MGSCFDKINDFCDGKCDECDEIIYQNTNKNVIKENKLTREARIELARKKLAKLKEISKSGKLADRMEWRPKAKIMLHPDTELYERKRVWFPKEIEDKKAKGRKKNKVVNVPYIVPMESEKCPFNQLINKLKNDSEIDLDDVVIEVGSGRNKTELVKGDIINAEGYNYKNSLKPQKDFVCSAIKIENVKGSRPDNLKIEVLSGAKSLLNEIKKEIEAEQDESGEEDGNPFINPYPFLIKFDETETPANMYYARASTKFDKDDRDLNKLLEEECPDISNEIKVNDLKELCEIINDSIVIDGLFVSLDGVEEEEKVEEKPKSKKRKAKKEKIEEPEVEEDELEVEEDEVEEQEDEVEEQEVKEEPKKRRGRPKKEKVEKDEVEKPKKRRGRPKKEKVESEVKEEVEKPKKQRGRPKKEKVEKVEEEVKELIEEVEDEVEVVVSGYEDPKDDPGEKPDDKNIGWWPDRSAGEEYEMCPKCNRPIPMDDDLEKCPHNDCDAEFDIDDDDDDF